MKGWMILAALVLGACVTATGGEPRTRPVSETERVEIRGGDRYVDPAGGLEIQPILIEVNRATFAVRVDGIVRTLELTIGPLGSDTIPPYTFELVSTTMSPSATLLITRVR